VESIGLVGLLLSKFAGIKKSVKGVSARNLFLQVVYFFLDGTSRHLSYFDELQQDEGYRAVVEIPQQQGASSHTVKRFFAAFNIFMRGRSAGCCTSCLSGVCSSGNRGRW
jgi:hypothetical protein